MKTLLFLYSIKDYINLIIKIYLINSFLNIEILSISLCIKDVSGYLKIWLKFELLLDLLLKKIIKLHVFPKFHDRNIFKAKDWHIRDPNFINFM